jgi:HEAT repeat protein
MNRQGNPLPRGALIVLPLICLGWATRSLAYIDMAPTLAKIMTDSKNVAVVEVTEFDRTKHVAVLRGVRALKGDLTADPIRHDVSPEEGGVIPRHILQWAGPGARAVLFVSRNTGLVCTGQGWYQVRSTGAGLWRLGKDRPDLPLAYYGSLSRLTEGIERMLAGKDAILTVVAHGAEDEAASFDLALNRTSVPELVRVQRIRADLKMPPMVMAASSDPAYFLGVGAVDEADLPGLLERLKSSDPMMRADAAEDLRRLGSKAKDALEPLTKLLSDSAPKVRLAAAAAVLRIDPPDAQRRCGPKDTHGVELLSKGLDSTDPTARRDAARAAGLAGPAAASLTPKLAALLKDADESTRITALQAISILGPAASKAREAVVALLDNPDLAVDAADALGRMGPAAQPVPGQLVKMLSSQSSAVRWAAVRAMAQIGGAEAHPAVDFMVQALPRASEVEGYNMMIYLALLGPVARDAADILWSAHIKHPVLPSVTRWAISGGASLPWLGGPEGRGPGRPGFGGRPGGSGGLGGGGGDIGSIIYQALVRELGERLRPTARLLAQKIMDGTAGNVPTWGYEILACAPNETMNALVPHLADDNIVMRERATVALGYMGPAAAPARERITAALAKVSSEREKRLMEWCLREISRTP